MRSTGSQDIQHRSVESLTRFDIEQVRRIQINPTRTRHLVCRDAGISRRQGVMLLGNDPGRGYSVVQAISQLQLQSQSQSPVRRARQSPPDPSDAPNDIARAAPAR